MVQIDLEEEQVRELLKMINSASFRGDGAEKVVEIKQALQGGLDGIQNYDTS